MLETGVAKYVFMKVNYTFGFPVDFHGVAHVNCSYCRMYDKYKNRCNITDEPIVEPTRYVGFECPLELMQEGGDSDAGRAEDPI